MSRAVNTNVVACWKHWKRKFNGTCSPPVVHQGHLQRTSGQFLKISESKSCAAGKMNRYRQKLWVLHSLSINTVNSLDMQIHYMRFRLSAEGKIAPISYYPCLCSYYLLCRYLLEAVGTLRMWPALTPSKQPAEASILNGAMLVAGAFLQVTASSRRTLQHFKATSDTAAGFLGVSSEFFW